MDDKNSNNKVVICGKIVSGFEHSHSYYGENFYITKVMAMRQSGYEDIIPVMVSDRLINIEDDWMNQNVYISGQFRSYNQESNGSRRLLLFVFAREFSVDLYGFNNNEIYINGYICKETVYRKTPLGREIADILVAANRSYGKSDYIPCIAWGRNAVFAGSLCVGSRIQVEGRIQSREYTKVLEDGSIEKRTAYEVSCSKIIDHNENKEEG